METTGVTPPTDGLSRDGPEPAEAAKQMASAAGTTVKQEVASFAASAQDKAHAAVDEQRQTAAKAIGDFATAIQHAGDELAQNDQSMAGHLIKQAADRLGQLAHTVSDKRPEELLTGLRDFGRRNPAAFAAASALAGFAIGRLVRSSVEPMDDQPSGSAMGFRSGAQATDAQLPVLASDSGIEDFSPRQTSAVAGGPFDVADESGSAAGVSLGARSDMPGASQAAFGSDGSGSASSEDPDRSAGQTSTGGADDRLV